MPRNVVKRGSWLVYFNGIEIPAETVSITGAVNTLPQATVTLPPDVTMRRIGAEDRVRLTVFYLDQWRHLVEDPAGGVPEWRLLFDGEIVDWGWVNSAHGRALRYVAVDMLEVLGKIFPHLITGLQSMSEQALALDGNAATSAVNPFAITNSLFTVGLNSGQRIERPFDFVKNVLDLLASPDAPVVGQRSAVVTRWFQRWAERTRFTSRFVPSYGVEQLGVAGTTGVPGVFPMWRAMQSLSALDALIKTGDRVAGAGSMYGLIQAVFQQAYYELHAHLAPPAPVVNDDWEISRSSDPRPTRQIVANYSTKPQMMFGIPPACNVIWASQIEEFSYQENYSRQPTRTYVGDTHLFNVMTGKKGVPQNPDNALDYQAIRALTSGYPPEADALLDRKLAGRDGHANHHNLLVYPEEFFKGPTYNNHDMPPLFSMLAETQGRDKSFPRKYARYEHFRMRYAQRNGGVSGPFNPYVVHGHPGVVLDSAEANMFTWGYFTQVTHTLTQASMSTTVAYTFAQPFEDFFESLVEDVMQYFGPNDSFDPEKMESMAPAHPVADVRHRFQVLPHAEEYYHAMLWRLDTLQKDDHVIFDWTRVVGVEKDGEVVDIDLDARERSNAIADEERGIVPVYAVKRAFQRYMEDPEEAFKFASRPVCTLDEWIDFHANGVREDPREAGHPSQGKGARYWVRILDLAQGPGQDPGTSLDGVPCGPDTVDTRRNWEARFLRFREKVYEKRRARRA